MAYTASGIGSIAGPMLAPWRARRESEARQITARGEREVGKILAEGQADTMRLIANAQADARAILISPDFSISGELDMSQAIHQRVQFQEEKRQRNILAVVEQAAAELGDNEVESSEPNHDWTARFFSEVQDVSSEDMQVLWSKVLAGEVERPGSTSLRTLDILRNIDRATAALFRKFCSACVSIRMNEKQFIDARVPSLGGNAGGNTLQKYGLGFGSLNLLNEHGLIISDYNSWYDYRICTGIQPNHEEPVLLIPFTFQGQHWALMPKKPRDTSQEFRLSGVALTRSGQELSTIVGIEPMNEYTQALVKFFETQNLRMAEVDSPHPRSIPISQWPAPSKPI